MLPLLATAPSLAFVHVQSSRGAFAAPHNVPPTVRLQKDLPAQRAVPKNELKREKCVNHVYYLEQTADDMTPSRLSAKFISQVRNITVYDVYDTSTLGKSQSVICSNT